MNQHTSPSNSSSGLEQDNTWILEYDPFHAGRNGIDLPAPSDEDCYNLWDAYAMPEHIRVHSMRVGEVAQGIAAGAQEAGFTPHGNDLQLVRAAGLLHDLAKSYSIEHGGQHAKLGAAWVLEETGNALLAQSVLHHVWWPLDVDPTKHFLPLAVLYADKRVKHERIVPLGVRYADLFERYAKNKLIHEYIERSFAQSKAIEAMFEEILGVNLNACTFDSGRLVERT